MKNLEKAILDKAKKQAKIPSFSKEQVILPDLSETSIIDSKYSKEIGEEGDRLSLTAKTETTFYAYDKNLLVSFLLKELEKEVRGVFVVKKDHLSYKINQAEKDKKNIDLKIFAKAKATPELDENEVIKKILGRNQNNLETILKSDFKVHGYNFVINNPLPILNNYLPFFKKNIILNISSL